MPSVESLPATAAPTAGPDPAAVDSTCQLGNGNKHVVEVFFDNVHFFRDNPNVQSDIEQIPALENFVEDNGTFLSNNHTPLIAHTADDSITNYTGLYGDRQGMGISNDYEVYNSTHTDVNSARLVGYWTDPINYSAHPGHRPVPNQPYSPTVPATQTTVNGQDAQDPAPWVPFTRAGCDTGDVVHGEHGAGKRHAGHRRRLRRQLARAGAAQRRHRPGYNDQEVADYGGLDRSLRPEQRDLLDGAGRQVRPDNPVADAVRRISSPTEPGGYTGFQQLRRQVSAARSSPASSPPDTRRSSTGQPDRR